MMPKNFLKARDKKGNRLIWLMGLAAIGLFAFLAAGSLDESGPRPVEESSTVPAPEPLSQAEAAAAAEAALKPGADQEPSATKRRFGRGKSTRPMSSPEGPSAGSIGRTLGSLGLIIAVLFGGAAFGARFLKKLRMKPSGENVLELVDVIALGPKRQVFVVSAYGRKIVVGATSESMSVLTEFDQDEIAAETAPPAFEQRLDRNMERLERRAPTLALELEA